MAEPPDPKPRTAAQQQRDLQLLEMRRAAHADLARRAQGNPYRPPPDPSVIQREATRAAAGAFSVAGPIPAAAAVPPRAAAAAGLRVNHPKIQAGDLKPIKRRTDVRALYRMARTACANRRKGDPLRSSVMSYLEAIVWFERADRVGYVSRTAVAYAKFTGMCERTIKRCQRFCEAHGLIDVLNSLRWADGDLRRGPNVCVPTVDEAVPVPDDIVATMPEGLVKRALSGLQRLGALFGLAVRPWGLNATALSNPRTLPTPA